MDESHSTCLNYILIKRLKNYINKNFYSLLSSSFLICSFFFRFISIFTFLSAFTSQKKILSAYVRDNNLNSWLEDSKIRFFFSFFLVGTQRLLIKKICTSAKVSMISYIGDLKSLIIFSLLFTKANLHQVDEK